MTLPFGYEQELCDVLSEFLPDLVVHNNPRFQATYVRRAVGQVIPDFLSISGPVEQEQLQVRALSSLDAAIIAALLPGRPLHAATIADRLYAALHQVVDRLDKLTRSRVVMTGATGTYGMRPSLRQANLDVVAVEAKLTRWREAIGQAVTYRQFANSVYVALPHQVITTTKHLLTEARRARVGVIGVSPGRAELIRRAPSADVRSPDWVWLISRTVGLPSNTEEEFSTC